MVGIFSSKNISPRSSSALATHSTSSCLLSAASARKSAGISSRRTFWLQRQEKNKFAHLQCLEILWNQQILNGKKYIFRSEIVYCEVTWHPYPNGPSKYMLRSSIRSMMPRMFPSRPMGMFTNAALWFSLVLDKSKYDGWTQEENVWLVTALVITALRSNIKIQLLPVC